MIRHTLILISVLIIILNASFARKLHAQETKDPASNSKRLKFSAIEKSSSGVRVPLLNILATYGEAYSCFFTIEEASGEGESNNPMTSRLVELISSDQEFHQNLFYDLQELSHIVPNLSFEVNQSNPHIIHIIDSRLEKQKNYGLEKVISSIAFKGTVRELINAISDKGISIAPPLYALPLESEDIFTKVQVQGEELKVRDALSNFVKLKGSNHIIWIARTDLSEGSTTYIHFK